MITPLSGRGKEEAPRDFCFYGGTNNLIATKYEVGIELELEGRGVVDGRRFNGVVRWSAAVDLFHFGPCEDPLLS